MHPLRGGKGLEPAISGLKILARGFNGDPTRTGKLRSFLTALAHATRLR